MIITSTYARAIYRVKFGGKFPAHYSWRLLVNLETIPDGDQVYTFTVLDTLNAIVGTRKLMDKEQVA